MKTIDRVKRRNYMVFTGISRVFFIKNNAQYETIGVFRDEMSDIYGMENLRGLGYNRTEDSIEYVIGLKEYTNEIYFCLGQF